MNAFQFVQNIRVKTILKRKRIREEMKNSSKSTLGSPSVRFVIMVLVVILLNFGLFFFLNFLAPLVTGFIVGFLLTRIRDGIAACFSGTVLSYLMVFVVSEMFLGFRDAPLDVAVAVLIMGVIGACGGILGSLVSIRAHK
jgi:hypothetical protein